MGPYVKLFGSILTSSVWCEPQPTRLVWITLLLLADGEGKVWGAVPGIARQAGVTVEEARTALAALMAPDPDSRTKDHEGRRLLEIEGGWSIINARKYREMQTNGQRRASERARRYRASHSVTSRDGRDASRASRTEEEKESEEETKKRTRTTDSGLRPATEASPRVVVWSREACDVWIARFGGTAPGGQIGKALKPLVDRHGWPEVSRAWSSYLSQTEAEYASASRFAATYGRWSGDSPAAVPKSKAAQQQEANRQAMARFVAKGEA